MIVIERIAGSEASGLSGVRWCTARGLEENQLLYWRRKQVSVFLGDNHISISMLTACTETGKESNMTLGKTTNQEAVHLFDDFEELSKSEYLKIYGSESFTGHPLTKEAINIARVTINPRIIDWQNLKAELEILINSFDNINYIAVVDSITEYDNSWVLSGKIAGTDNGYISLSFTGEMGLGTIKIASLNTAYLIRFNHAAQSHYLFKALIDEIEKPIH